MLLTVLKIWAVVNLIGIAIATAAGIYRDLTGGDEQTDAAEGGGRG